MVTKRREENRGSQVKNVRKSAGRRHHDRWGGRNGSVNSVPNPTCGRGGAAGDAITSGRVAGKIQAGDCDENG